MQGLLESSVPSAFWRHHSALCLHHWELPPLFFLSLPPFLPLIASLSSAWASCEPGAQVQQIVWVLLFCTLQLAPFISLHNRSFSVSVLDWFGSSMSSQFLIGFTRCLNSEERTWRHWRRKRTRPSQEQRSPPILQQGSSDPRGLTHKHDSADFFGFIVLLKCSYGISSVGWVMAVTWKTKMLRVLSGLHRNHPIKLSWSVLNSKK